MIERPCTVMLNPINSPDSRLVSFHVDVPSKENEFVRYGIELLGKNVDPKDYILVVTDPCNWLDDIFIPADDDGTRKAKITYLKNAASQVQFLFTYPQELITFVDKFAVKPVQKDAVKEETVEENWPNKKHPRQYLPIRVTIKMFWGPQFEKQEKVETRTMAHGYDTDARRHLKQWMAALQKLASRHSHVHVSIDMARPWRDYRKLRAGTSVLRQAGITFDLVLPQPLSLEKDWGYGVGRTGFDFHVASTLCALKGGKLDPTTNLAHFLATLSLKEAQDLGAIGTRGFRGLPA